ncbi:MAG: TRAP transporter small permease [Candidatus Binatia bacterium]
MIWVYNRLLDTLAFVAALLIFAIMLGVGADVAGRYIFARPLVWIHEFTEYSLLCVLSFGMAWLVRERGHVAIEILVDSVPVPLANAMKIVSAMIACAISAALGYWAMVAAVGDYQRGIETYGIYPIPRFLLFAVIAVGLILTAVEFARVVVVLWRGGDKAKRNDLGDVEDKIQPSV